MIDSRFRRTESRVSWTQGQPGSDVSSLTFDCDEATSIRVQVRQRVHVINGVDGFRFLCDWIIEEQMVDDKLVAFGPHDSGGGLDRGRASLCDWSASQRTIVIAGAPGRECALESAIEYL